MNRLPLLFLCCFFVFSCNKKLTTLDEQVQKGETISESKTNAAEFVGIELDMLGNKYIYSEIEIVKISSEGDTLAIFNTRNTSGISKVSVSNPNKVIVFSKDNQRSWTLDSTLSVIEDKTLDLPDFGVIGMVTRLEGDDILYYSRSNKRFYRTNNSTSKIIESDVQWDIESEIVDIVESEDQFIIRTEKNEIYLHDAFGNRVKKISGSFVDGPIDFQHNFLFQVINDQLNYLDITDPTAEFKEYKLSGGLKNITDFKMDRQKLIAISNGEIVEQKIMIVNY